MKKKLMLLLTFLFVGLSMAIAQTQKITGVVISEEDGEPVIGASVIVVGHTTIGTTTDMNGNFTLTDVPASAKMLRVSYIGMATQEVPIKSIMKIVLKPDNEMIDEVLVVAYGTAKKSSFTGAAAMVDSKKISKVQAPDAVKALEGMVPGLQVSSSSGAPGSSTTIRIRGMGSINASSSPLIILNGAPYDGNINSINPNDIENLSVLKDAASAALYGARGANGVIIITTKSGSQGQTSVNFEARIGENQRGVPEYEVLRNPGDFYRKYWEAMRNDFHLRKNKPLSLEAANAKATEDLIGVLGYNIYNVDYNKVVLTDGTLNPNAVIRYEDADSFNDWTGHLLSPKMRQEYNLSLTRGTDKSKTYFSVGYLNDKGYARNTEFERISSRMSYDTEFYSWLKMSVSSQLAVTSGNFGNSGATTFSNVFFFTRTMPPIYPVYLHNDAGQILLDENGNKRYDLGVKDVTVNSNGNRLFSPNKNIIGETDLNKQNNERLYLTNNVRFDLTLPYNFKFNTTFSHYYYSSRENRFTNPVMGDGVGYGGILRKYRYINTTTNWNQVLTWDKKFGDVTLQAMLGHESYANNYNTLSGEKRKTLVPTSLEFNTYAQMTELSSGQYDYRVEGYFAQLTGDYKDKYYFSGSIRRDGSSIFSRDNRWGTFWSLGASWRIKEESFMKDVKWVNSLKVRASIGEQGNDNLLDTDGYRMYTPYTNLYSVGSDGTDYSFGAAYKGNSEITWEKNLNISAGLEFSLFDHRLTGEFDFFKRKTTDMLFNEPVSKTTGFTFEPKNLGSMQNVGFEFLLKGIVYTSKDVEVSLGVNGTSYKNKILELPERFKEDGIPTGARILKEGGGIGDLYMVKYAGVNPETGDSQYWLKNASGEFEVMGSAKYESAMKHRQFIGSAIPKLEGGFDINVAAYGFDFSMQYSYRLGGLMRDAGYEAMMHSGRSEASNWHKDILNSWSTENKNTNIPRVQLSNQALISASDMFITKADYLSLRNLTLGYTFPNSIITKLGLKKLRVYLAADNVFLLSKRKGFDPRTSLYGTSSNAQASVIRTVSGGIAISL